MKYLLATEKTCMYICSVNGILTFLEHIFTEICVVQPINIDILRTYCNKNNSLFSAAKLGIKDLLPAYLGTNLTNEDLLTGVSFASGGTGYDPLTAQIAVYKLKKERKEMH
jgi:hypothetical protein